MDEKTKQLGLMLGAGALTGLLFNIAFTGNVLNIGGLIGGLIAGLLMYILS